MTNSKGERTRTAILNKAMGYTSLHGLGNVTIGEVAKITGLSRTGVISHFKNKEDMQLAILNFMDECFIEKVIIRSRHPEPLQRLEGFFRCWQEWIQELEDSYAGGSCPFIKALLEYQDREDCPIQAQITERQIGLMHYIEKLADRCVDAGTFDNKTNPKQFASRSYSYYLGYNISKNLYGRDKAKDLFYSSLDALILSSRS